MYTLFKERFYYDKDGIKQHECDRKIFEILEDAQKEMASDYEDLKKPDDCAFLLNLSFIITRGFGETREMILYGILFEDES